MGPPARARPRARLRGPRRAAGAWREERARACREPWRSPDPRKARASRRRWHSPEHREKGSSRRARGTCPNPSPCSPEELDPKVGKRLEHALAQKVADHDHERAVPTDATKVDEELERPRLADEQGVKQEQANGLWQERSVAIAALVDRSDVECEAQREEDRRARDDARHDEQDVAPALRA